MPRNPTRPILTLMLALGFAIAGLAHASGRGKIPISPERIDPLPIGATIPDATVKNAEGADVALSDVFGTKPTILIFYRGGW